MYSANGKPFGFPVPVNVPGLSQDEEEAQPSASQTAYTPTETAPAEVVPITSAAEAKQVVTLLQQRLKSKGFDPGAIDGIWGKKTEAALDNARINARLAVGTDRVTVLQRSLNLPYTDAARVRDAINYQIAARAKKPTTPAPEPSVLPVLPDLPAAAVGLTSKWWFWALVVAGVAGAGVATYYIVKKSKEGKEFEEEGVPPSRQLPARTATAEEF